MGFIGAGLFMNDDVQYHWRLNDIIQHIDRAFKSFCVPWCRADIFSFLQLQDKFSP